MGKKLTLLLKGKLKRTMLSYAQLVCELADIGVMDSELNIRNKIRRAN